MVREGKRQTDRHRETEKDREIETERIAAEREIGIATEREGIATKRVSG